MGYLIPRKNKYGETRYTAMYLDINGAPHSCGTYDTDKEANRRWQDKEADVRAGRIGDARRGKQLVRRYATVEWFPNHQIEISTRATYQIMLDLYILPYFGDTMRMTEVRPSHTRHWIKKMQEDGVNPPTIEKAKVVFDAMFTTAFNDQIVMWHPGRGVTVPAVARNPRRIVTADQFDVFHMKLSEPVWRLLVETDMETGLRWGELTELRPSDFDFGTAIVTVARVAVEVDKQHRVDGQRFVVKNYTKNQDWRQIKIPSHLSEKIKYFVSEHNIGLRDLLFCFQQPGTRRETLPQALPNASELGLVSNDKGHKYFHGTTSGYTAGQCRCDHCRNAMAAYRAARRSKGMDSPRTPRSVDTDGHIPSDWFRHNVWNKALNECDFGFRITPHSLRHAHASWLLAGGADLQVVKARLGHRTIRTTERYLHELPNAGDSALAALENFRAGRTIGSVETTTARELGEMRALLEQIKGGESSESPLQQLRSLADLREMGVLTEAEFEAKKAAILARIQ